MPASPPPLPALPIFAALPEVRAALRDAHSAVLEAPPGAGKSTLVPLALLDEPWLQDAGGRPLRIVMLQPRRIAARAVARRIAALAATEPGELVGYRTRLETRVGPRTRIEVVTEGILTRMLQSDPALEGVGCVIFDEFHERNLQSDLGLALALDVQRHLRQDLRLLVMSATLDAGAVAALLGTAARIRAPGRAYPVTTAYVPPLPAGHARRPAPIAERAARATLRALAEHPGDVLVFLPGAGEIRRACEAIAAGAGDPRLDVLPLYGELDAAAQDAALQPAIAGRRKVVVATNIAETSLTIEGVRVVVDAGLERRLRFDPVVGLGRLETVPISRASADQRRGRAGRTAPGACLRLWSESTHDALPAQSPPEMLEADLAPLALELACWGVADPSGLAWLDPPRTAALAQARGLLVALEALDERGAVTPVGRRMAALGAHPRLAHMIERARPMGLARLACDVAALLGERDVLRPATPGARDPDLRHRIDALAGASAPPGFVVDTRALQQVRRASELLWRRLPADRSADSTAPVAPDDAVGLLLSFAYPDRIGLARGGGDGRYLLSGGRGATLPAPSALARSELVVAAALDAGEREASVHLAAPVARALLELHHAARIDEIDVVRWDARSEVVVARRVRRLGALVLAEQVLRHSAHDAAVLAALIEGIRSLGLACLPWTDDLRCWRDRVALLHAHAASAEEAAEWPDVGDEALMATLPQWLGPYLAGVSRRDHLARVDLRSALRGLLDWRSQRRLDELAPTHLVVPSGSRIAVDYSAGQPTLAVRLQEVFGWTATPRIAGGRVPVTLALLSPARRPVQVTQDLASFWSRGYAEVRKELKGRYPRHSWPEDPMAATPTRKVRPPGT